MPKYIQVPLEVLRHLPHAAVVDSLGTVVWTPTNTSSSSPLAVGKNILDVIPEGDLAKMLSGNTFHFATIDGTSYLVRGYPLETSPGATLVFELVETDSLAMFIENPYEGFVFVDKNGFIRAINSTAANYMKIPKEEMIGQHIDKLKIDRRLHSVMETQKHDLLSVYLVFGKNGLASRHPVYHEGELVGAYGRYFSIDGRDLKENTFGEEYADLLDGLQVTNISQAMVNLNAYKQEFYEKNTTRYGVENIVGNSSVMTELKKKILMTWDSPSSVLLTGDSGTGKELFAQAIHFHSNRAKYPFVKVNCAAIPENLLESELFGYVDGAFTGARKGGKMGKFELAHKGIIFLDEIGDMQLSMQAKLLRVLQEKEIERLGSETVIPIDVKVVSATNKDLYAAIREGTFRSDLFYRLNVININIPTLKERKSDIPELVAYFIKNLNVKLNRNIKTVSPEVMERFMRYDWPGNIRELINVLESAMNFCRSDVLSIDELPHLFVNNILDKNSDDKEDLQSTMDELKMSEILAALEKNGGKRNATAAMLGISKSTLYRLMKKYDLLDTIDNSS